MQAVPIVLLALLACQAPAKTPEAKPAYVPSEVLIHVSPRPATGSALKVADNKYISGGFRVDTATSDVGVPFAEPIVAATKTSAGWIFVLQDGSVHRSQSFTGATTRVARLSPEVAIASEGGGVPLLLGTDGRLWRIAPDGNSAPVLETMRVAYAWLDETGKGIAFTFDGLAMQSTDSGRTWSETDADASSYSGALGRSSQRRWWGRLTAEEATTKGIVDRAILSRFPNFAFELGYRRAGDKLVHLHSFVIITPSGSRTVAPPEDFGVQWSGRTALAYSEDETRIFDLDSGSWRSTSHDLSDSAFSFGGSTALWSKPCPDGRGRLCAFDLSSDVATPIELDDNVDIWSIVGVTDKHAYLYWGLKERELDDRGLVPEAEPFRGKLGRLALDKAKAELVPLAEADEKLKARLTADGDLLLPLTTKNFEREIRYQSFVRFGARGKRTLPLPKGTREFDLSASRLAVAITDSTAYASRDRGQSWHAIGEHRFSTAAYCGERHCSVGTWSVSLAPFAETVIASEKKHYPWHDPLVCNEVPNTFSAPEPRPVATLTGKGKRRTLSATWHAGGKKHSASANIVVDEETQPRAHWLAGDDNRALLELEVYGVEDIDKIWYLLSGSKATRVTGAIAESAPDLEIALPNGTFALSSGLQAGLVIVDPAGVASRPIPSIFGHDGLVVDGNDAGMFWGAREGNSLRGFYEVSTGPRAIHLSFASGRREQLILDFEKALHTPCKDTTAPGLRFVVDGAIVDVADEDVGRLDFDRVELLLQKDRELCLAKGTEQFEARGGRLVGPMGNAAYSCAPR